MFGIYSGGRHLLPLRRPMSDATVAAAASVAVAIITAVVGPTVLARYKLRHPAARVGARRGRPLIPSRPGLTGARVVLRESGPRAVLGRLAEIPPLSRRAVANELFVGRWAEWSGIVREVRESERGYVVDVVDPDDGASAELDFAADERPVLESLREGDRISYVGRITGTEAGRVVLDSPTISRAGPITGEW